MTLNESILKDAAHEWFWELGYDALHGPHLAPSEPSAERDSVDEVVLVGRLRAPIRRLNPVIPNGGAGNTQGILVSSNRIEKSLNP